MLQKDILMHPSKKSKLDLRGVLIDFGDTLAYVDKYINRKYMAGLLSILKKHGYKENIDQLTLNLDDVYYRSSKGEAKDLEEFWTLLLADLAMTKNTELLDELVEFWSHNYSKIFKLYEGVTPVLSDLRSKYKLALVSNCSTGLSKVIEALGIASFFETIILSYEVGARKPDRRIYLQTLRSIKLPSEKCIFVSDEISDLEGAKEIGLKTLLVRQGAHTTGDAKNPGFKPNLTCNRISEITELI